MDRTNGRGGERSDLKIRQKRRETRKLMVRKEKKKLRERFWERGE